MIASLFKNIKVYWLIGILLLMPCINTWAEDVTFTATVDANKITLGNSLQLMLTITGKQNIDQLQLPPIDGFDVRFLGPQVQVSIANGKYSTSKTFVYGMFSLKTGNFTIPSFTVNIDGKDYKTDPIEVMVEDTGAASGGQEATTSGSPSSVTLQDKIMLVLQSPQKEAYLHEQIPVHAKLFFSGVQIGEVQYPALETTGFTITNFTDEQYQQVLNGMSFKVIDFKAFLTPTRTGDLTIGPAQVQANLLSPVESQGSSLFDNFFTTYQRRPFTVHSLTTTIKVLPLPEEGKPADFTGAVGAFDFDAGISPIDLKVGDPITLRMKVTGQGDLKAVTMPVFDDPAFKIYDPQIKDEGNSKVLEQVIIPASVNIKEVPAISFSYFDTRAKEYRTITKGPFSIIVTAAQAGEEFRAVGFENSRPTVQTKEEVGRDIVFIKERLDDLRPKGRHLYHGLVFWLAVMLYSIAWLAALGFYFFKKKLSSDVRFARKYHAPRNLRLGMDKAKGFAQDNNAGEFYSMVVKIVAEYAGALLDVSAAGLTFDVLSRHLKSRHVKDEIINDLRSVFDTADKVRFASFRPSASELNEDFTKIKAIMEHLEKQL